MPTGKNWVNKSFSISLDDLPLLEELGKIARRESPAEPSISKQIVKAIKEYIPRHGSEDPNYQQRLEDYNKEGTKTTAYLKGQVLAKFSENKEATFKQILREVKQIGIKAERQLEVAETVARELHGKGVRIWR